MWNPSDTTNSGMNRIQLPAMVPCHNHASLRVYLKPVNCENAVTSTESYLTKGATCIVNGWKMSLKCPSASQDPSLLGRSGHPGELLTWREARRDPGTSWNHWLGESQGNWSHFSPGLQSHQGFPVASVWPRVVKSNLPGRWRHPLAQTSTTDTAWETEYRCPWTRTGAWEQSRTNQ